MSRPSNKAPFKLYEGRKTKDRHVRLTDNMLKDDVWLSLPPSAKILYIYMKLWACGNDTFQYSKSLATNIMSPSAYISSVRTLISKGFIEKTGYIPKGGHTPTTYKFSTKWLNKMS